ncbi:hypothetical protein Fmac_020862 [Flemingia macrophylla]|uniref:Uncharacterized protein n=1 Tax=Flemingia macrophylla TaxID=520843 RepID=A0ABD1LV64_9FABA
MYEFMGSSPYRKVHISRQVLTVLTGLRPPRCPHYRDPISPCPQSAETHVPSGLLDLRSRDAEDPPRGKTRKKLRKEDIEFQIWSYLIQYDHIGRALKEILEDSRKHFLQINSSVQVRESEKLYSWVRIACRAYGLAPKPIKGFLTVHSSYATPVAVFFPSIFILLTVQSSDATPVAKAYLSLQKVDFRSSAVSQSREVHSSKSFSNFSAFGLYMNIVNMALKSIKAYQYALKITSLSTLLYLELQTSELDVLGVLGKIRKRYTNSLLEEKPISDVKNSILQDFKEHFVKTHELHEFVLVLWDWPPSASLRGSPLRRFCNQRHSDEFFNKPKYIQISTIAMS